jgi:hypothetical protein
MDIHYAVLTATGINDPSRALASAQEALTVRDTFADAKAEVVARADAVLDYLVSTDRTYTMHVESRDQHFEVRFEYGPVSAQPTLPFRMVLKVGRCTLRHGRVEPIDSSPETPSAKVVPPVMSPAARPRPR